MSSDLSTRVRSYAAKLEHEVAHVTVAEIERRLADTAIKPQVDTRRQVRPGRVVGLRPLGEAAPFRRKRPRPVVVVVVALSVTLLLIGVLGLTGLLGGNDPNVIDTNPTVVTTVPPWDRFQHEHNVDTLNNVISDWTQFETAYNTAYLSHQSCEEAYAGASEGHDGYLRVLEEDWVDEVSDRPGVEYDRFVGQLLASELWLRQNGCPGAWDFLSVG